MLAETPVPYFYVLPRSFIDQSLPVARRYWGGTAGTPGSSITVDRFSDTRKATVAWLHWNDLLGWNVQQDRRLYFAKNRFLWVRDQYTFPAASMQVAVGSLWHAGDVHPSHGSNWFDLYYRQPLANVWEQKNPERYAALYFLQRSGEDVAEWKEPTYTAVPNGCLPVPAPPAPTGACETVNACYRSGPPYVIAHRWKGQTTSNGRRWMDAVLVPHGAPAGVAPAITVLHDDGRNVALRITVEGEEWTLVDNPDLITISNGSVTTNARYLMTRTKPGLPPYILAHDSTNVTVPPSIALTWPVRTSVEIGGY